jgi:outer membrane receptor protein involved in Fe transport
LASNYNYDFSNDWVFGKQNKEMKFNWKSTLRDYSFKYDLGYYMNDATTIKAGLVLTYHDIDPGNVTGNQDTLNYSYNIPASYSFENAVYLLCEQKISPKFTVNYGLRYTFFQNIGKATVYKLNSAYETIDTLEYKKGDIFNYYHNFEPRLGLTYVINDNSSLKAGYSRTSQYMHLVSNSTVSSLMDIWVCSGPNIKPESANIYSIGLFKNFLNNKIETSVEVYYKDMKNLISFREFAQPQFNQRMEEDFRFGIGKSYGIEMFIRKNEGRFTGWVSYTFSKTEQKTEGIQQKGWYLSSFDRPHDLSIVGMYEIAKRFSISANFSLKSGRLLTSPVIKYVYQQAVVPYFEKLNNDRLPLYHRLDLSLAYKSKEKPGKRFHSEWILSVYDVYNQINPTSIYFKPDENNERVTKAYKQNLFGITPSITWNFTFN